MGVSRRHFFADFGRSLLGGLFSPADDDDAARDLVSGHPATDGAGAESSGREPVWVRPPGAIPDEPLFREVCGGCGSCVLACPYQAIRRLGTEFGDNAGTPAIIPSEAPCYLCQDLPCVAVCRTGALQPTTLKDAGMGLALLDSGRCYLSAGQPCDYCFERCPIKGEAIVPGEDGLPVIDENACPGCGVCAYLCPADALAIRPARLLTEGTNL